MSSNKTIVKNSFFLYFRMLITMGVGLYTSRLILEALGVVDYGLYGLVGGIVTMFAFLNSSMSSATQRYLSFDIGKGDEDRLQKTFNASLNIHFLIGFIIVILAETIGLWFVNYKLDIPVERMTAANWVYQFSIFTFFFNVIQVPYNALLIARERMNIYAYMSIVEVLLKLLIVFLVLGYDKDRLILYGVLTFAVSFITRMLYKLYCKRHFKESIYKFYYNKGYYKELLSYSGWNLFGNIAAVARGQGSNILLNLFFGPIANAAYSLTTTVQGVIGNFVSNFQVALNPQIIKNYAKGDFNESLDLMFKSSKFSFFAMFIIVVPIYLNMDFILTLWLKKVPSYTIAFLHLALIYSLIETISNPLMVGLQATGKIKAYQATVGTIIFLNFPIVWAVLKLTHIPEYTYLVFCVISVISLAFRLFFLKRTMDFKIFSFLKKVLLPILIIVFIMLAILKVKAFYFDYEVTLINFLIESFILEIFILSCIFIIGLSNSEKDFIKRIIFLKINKNK